MADFFCIINFIKSRYIYTINIICHGYCRNKTGIAGLGNAPE